MKKLFFLLAFILVLTGCPKSKIHTEWKDSALTKKEYLKREMKRQEINQDCEEGLIKPLQKALEPSW